MKVFSRDKFIKEQGLVKYNSFSKLWVDHCHMKTKEECSPFLIDPNWLVECREVHHKAKKGEYVRITESNFNNTFLPDDIVKCVDDETPICKFENEDGKRSSVNKSRYVVREIVEEEEKMENVKQLLKNGDMVINRQGEKYIFMTDYLGEKIFKSETNAYDRLYNYTKNLCNCVDNQLDIMEIKKPKRLNTELFNESEYETKWKREEVKEMTVAEIEKIPGYSIKVVKEEK